MGSYQTAEYYDTVFRVHGSYSADYHLMGYYPVWQWIERRLDALGRPAILELGSGTGQFARMLQDLGYRDYAGVDFSAQAVAIARKLAPEMPAAVGDITQDYIYRLPYGVIVCCETLEHLRDDRAVIAMIRPGAEVLMGVPCFDDHAHVRHFTDLRQVVGRYGAFLDWHEIESVAGAWVCHATRKGVGE